VLIPKAGYRQKETQKAREDEAEAVMVSPTPCRIRAKREYLGLLTQSQGHNLAVTAYMCHIRSATKTRNALEGEVDAVMTSPQPSTLNPPP